VRIFFLVAGLRPRRFAARHMSASHFAPAGALDHKKKSPHTSNQCSPRSLLIEASSTGVKEYDSISVDVTHAYPLTA